MFHQDSSLIFHLSFVFFFLIVGITATATTTSGQSPAETTLRLASDSPTNSQLAALRGDLVAAITQGASPAETITLIQRQQQVDQKLQVELDAVRTELVKIKNSDFNRDSQHRRAELRRRESLLWLSRVELASLLPELFAEGTADGIALANRAIGLVTEAIAKFPSGSELHRELSRLMSEAQLRSGDPDAAIHTMQQASIHDDGKSSSPNASAGEPPLVIKTSDELAFVIRIDLAKHRWEAAGSKLQQYYGEHPITAPPSPAMDLARLRYLIQRPDHASDLRDVGRWLDAIESRGGSIARRHAETLIARHRTPDLSSPIAVNDQGEPSKPMVDPRVIRADARYYLRVGETFLAAITFARAAVQDADSARSIESAIQSAAILQSVSQESAASELLRRIAATHYEHPSSPMLLLQAAAIRSEASDDASSAASHDLLLKLLADWPTSDAAKTARETLIESAIANADYIAAAVLATEMPAKHWSDSSAAQCLWLWQHAIAGPDPWQQPCHWDDEDCQREYAASLANRLATMRSAFAAAAPHPLAEATDLACVILLDSCIDPSNRERLEFAERNVKDPFLANLAQHRLGIRKHFDAPGSRVPDDVSLRRVAMWRLNQDLLESPVLHRDISTYLLTFVNEFKVDVDPRLQITWLMWSGRMEQGDRMLRETLPKADHPADLLAAAASALATSTHPAELRRASDLWQQLADGIPVTQRSHHRAKVESIACQWRSGDRSGARAAAELMLLTNPSEDPALTKRLLEWSS